MSRHCAALLALLFGGCGAAPASEDFDRPGAGGGSEARAPSAPAVTLQASLPPGLSGRLVFHADREGRHRLFTIDLPTRNVIRLTAGRDHHDEQAAWSPDGAQVAFVTTRFDYRTFDIAVMDAADATLRRVTTHLALDRHPAWAADGRSVLFSSEQDGTQAVFRAWLDTGWITRVSPPPERALMPAVSPDGRRVAYTMGTPGGLRIVVQDLKSGDVRPVTREGSDAAEPRWAPDGARLAYTRLSPAGSFIEVLTLGTGAVLSLAVEGLVELREPSWSADGRWVAAAGSPQSGVQENWDLVLLQPEPAAAFRLTSGPANDRAPSWLPR